MWLFPLDRAASLTLRVFLTGYGISLLLCAVALARRRGRWAALGGGLALTVTLVWTALYAARPAWMRYALAAQSPAPETSPLTWITRADGFETAEVSLSVDGHWVDQVALARVDPNRFKFLVRWDGAQPRTIDEWQARLGATIVMNGSYFLPDHTPQTPLRVDGHTLGPRPYQSQHAVFADGAILELAGQPLPESLAQFENAMVSYPVLLDATGLVRAKGEPDWLASRSFLAVDGDGRVLFGTTRTGYFTLRRLGEWLKNAPLGVRVALNLDGGPIASQAIVTPGFSRVMVGTAETNRGADVLRAFFQARRSRHWQLPIVVAAVPR